MNAPDCNVPREEIVPWQEGLLEPKQTEVLGWHPAVEAWNKIENAPKTYQDAS